MKIKNLFKKFIVFADKISYFDIKDNKNDVIVNGALCYPEIKKNNETIILSTCMKLEKLVCYGCFIANRTGRKVIVYEYDLRNSTEDFMKSVNDTTNLLLEHISKKLFRDKTIKELIFVCMGTGQESLLACLPNFHNKLIILDILLILISNEQIKIDQINKIKLASSRQHLLDPYLLDPFMIPSAETYLLDECPSTEKMIINTFKKFPCIFDSDT